MEVGIGLPNAVRGVDRAGIVDWAQRADAAGFSSLGTLDRLAYPSYEPLISLAAAAAVTERIQLATDILLAPLRTNAALLAKETATIDNLSNGRLVLGLAVGAREDDFQVSGVDFKRRGRIFDEQLEQLARFWKGEGGVGPATASGERPRLLIGGGSNAAFRRTARFADGWTMGGGTPDAFKEAMPKLQEAWEKEGRDGKPRTMAQDARDSVGDYYAYLGDYADQVVQSVAKDPETLKAYLSAFEEAGADEVICFPASADPAQVELLAQAL
jgi:alkanesulfonate monooxygenase SsuD/methylene tetrahydromethanopterin reductase-like flavin-dependent oxidoreductase (luciferase family)